MLAIVAAVVGALDHAHRRRLLHQDAKAANTMLAKPKDGEQRIFWSTIGYKPGDLVMSLGPLEEASGIDVPAGTVLYAGSEVLMGAPETADQYLLVANAFRLRTGAPLVEHSGPRTVFGQLLTGVSPTLSDQHHELARMDGVFCRMLTKKPAYLFVSSREFVDVVNEQAGVSTGDRSSKAVLTVDYPAYA
ncbi:hypothetical protein [Mycobacterium uberis]|uniref:hypothetical protein n=1 Tax=Mycobacterium uberis TaxID=2162698 RepID=UPI000E3091CE|nr:hypothetical protein [Mycobacterium uberis]